MFLRRICFIELLLFKLLMSIGRSVQYLTHRKQGGLPTKKQMNHPAFWTHCANCLQGHLYAVICIKICLALPAAHFHLITYGA